MINNSININKVNNHLSPKESLNSDDQQLYQYQQSEQPLNIKKTIGFFYKKTVYVITQNC